MTKINQRIEAIFSHAVALEQAGRFRNTIYALDNRIYIMNFDSTVLLRFRLRKTEAPFQSPISFRANDYDSKTFYEEDGRIVFTEEGGGFIRKKSCGTPEAEPADIEELFNGYSQKGKNTTEIHRDLLPLLETSLSHIELSAVDGVLKIVQRNIYDGTIIEISRKEAKGLNITQQDNLPEDFGPVGIRTGDFLALYAFTDLIEFQFSDGMDYVRCKSMNNTLDMSGRVALCTYDELGTISTVEGEDNGREKQEKRGSERSTDSETPKRQRRRRNK